MLCGDHLSDAIGLARHRVEGEMRGRAAYARLTVGPRRDQLFVDVLRHLETIRVIVLDQTVGRVQHGLR